MDKTEIQLGLGDMVPVVVTLAVAGLVAAFTLQVLSDIKGDFSSATSSEANATQDAIDGVAKIPEKLPTIGLVAAAAVIIGLLLNFFVSRR